MRKTLLLLLAPVFLNAQENTETEIINPKGNWYFGAEVGANKITSFNLGEPDISIQGGVSAEYYFNKNWSLTTGIKYFETGVSFFKPSSGGGSGFLSFSNPAYFGQFNGAVVCIPLHIKWNFKIYENFGAYLKLGFAHNFETKSAYNYSENLKTDYAKNYSSTTSGFGFNYFLNKKTALYTNYDFYLGDAKAIIGGFIFDSTFYVTNGLLSIGIKHNFKK
jgi:hypothetical protein